MLELDRATQSTNPRRAKVGGPLEGTRVPDIIERKVNGPLWQHQTARCGISVI